MDSPRRPAAPHARYAPGTRPGHDDCRAASCVLLLVPSKVLLAKVLLAKVLPAKVLLAFLPAVGAVQLAWRSW